MAAVALVGAGVAEAQERRLEIGGTVGKNFSDGVRRAAGVVGTSGLFANAITPDDSVSYGFFAAYFLNENVQLGLQFGRQESELQVTGEQPIEVGGMGVENYHAITTVLMGDDELQARPYFLFGLGVTRFGRVSFAGFDGVGRTIAPRTRFSPTVGTGAKFYLRSHKYGLNLGIRWTPTFLKSGSEGFWCDPYWGCFTTDESQFAHQFELAGGLQVRF
jgi:hypothetical protein